jgi:gamma-glutamyltranspeptidase/glutathione hydrolase
MGGAMQPQGHVQVATRLLATGQNPQAAVDAPRWRVEGDKVSRKRPKIWTREVGCFDRKQPDLTLQCPSSVECSVQQPKRSNYDAIQMIRIELSEVGR